MTATHDAAGRLTSLADSLAGTISWTYDALDRVTSETTPQGTITYAYDTAGRRTDMTVAGQTPVSYAYDSADRIAMISADSLAATYVFDNAGRRTTLTLPNGVSTQSTYDAASRLTGLTYVGPGGTLGTLTYTYDPAGNRIASGGSWARTLLPDPIATASYDAANRQLALSGKTMTFDANGNLATLTEGGQTTTFTWNGRDQLSGIAGPGLSAAFAYDGSGRRIQKTVNGQTTTFHYDEEDIAREISGGTESNYLSGAAL
ncbi:MAG TPA: Rhs family protein, partial [Candidatus Methylomirabilis sp.]